MPTPDEWRELIAAATQQRAAPVTAHTFLRDWATSSHPVLLACDNGRDYVVKGPQVGRRNFNDHIVGRLGAVIQAPVAEVGYVQLPQAMINAEPKLAHMTPGTSHGSLWISDCSEREGIQYFTHPDNRVRFARLAVLYGLVRASDHQFIYQKAHPNLVFSVDHGHFFPNGGDWQIAHLQGAPSAVCDNEILVACQLTTSEIDLARATLRNLTEVRIAEAVAGPMDDWGVPIDERIAAAIFIYRMRDELLVGLP